MKYKSIFISDIHLGTPDSKRDELIDFLKENKYDNLFILGDLIDGWELKRGSKWKKKDTNFFRFLLKIFNKKIKIVYIRGNHDDFLDEIVPFSFNKNFIIRRDYIYNALNGKKYYLCHGDVFDDVTSKLIWLSKLGDIGYYILLKINNWYNSRRAAKGLKYHSISQEIKSKVKAAVDFLNKFEKRCVAYTKHKECSGVICGHVHTPIIKEIDGIEYMNSGDWLESLSAIVETKEGNFKIVLFQPKKSKK